MTVLEEAVLPFRELLSPFFLRLALISAKSWADREKASSEAVKTARRVSKRLPSLESFSSPHEVFGSSYGRAQLIPLNLTGESLLLGKDQKAAERAPPHDWPLHGAHPFKC